MHARIIASLCISRDSFASSRRFGRDLGAQSNCWTRLRTARTDPMTFARALAAALLVACILAAGAASAQTYPSRPDHTRGAVPARRRNRCDRAHHSGQHVAIARPADHHREHRRSRRHDCRGPRSARHAGRLYGPAAPGCAGGGHDALPRISAFDAEKDFVAIGLINNAATTVVGAPRHCRRALSRELVHWMKEPGQNAKIAHPGIGSFGHLCSVLFAQEIGADGRRRFPIAAPAPRSTTSWRVTRTWAASRLQSPSP